MAKWRDKPAANLSEPPVTMGVTPGHPIPEHKNKRFYTPFGIAEAVKVTAVDATVRYSDGSQLNFPINKVEEVL